MKKTILLFIAVLFILPSLEVLADKKPAKNPVFKEKLIKELMSWRRNDRPGGSILVVKDKEILFNESFGTAVLEQNLANTTKTTFDILDVSQCFTAMAIYMLEKENKLALTDTLDTYIPKLPAWANTVTLRHLLDHTSGIINWQTALRAAGWREGDVITFNHIMNLVKRQHTLAFPPGSAFAPSATNYNLLAEVIKRVSHQSYRMWIREHIFKPLHMYHSTVRDRCGEPMENQALAYSYSRQTGYRRSGDNTEAPGSHGLFSNSQDLAKFIANFSDGNVGGKDVIEKMFSPGHTNDGTSTGFASGFNTGQFKGLKRLICSAHWDGYNICVYYFPDQKISIAVICNWVSSWVQPYFTAMTFANVYLEDYFKPQPASSTQKTPQKNKLVSVDINPDLLDRYTGEFRYRGGMTRFIRENDSLFITFPRSTSLYELFPLSETEFVLSYADYRFRFLANKDGQYDRFIQSGRTYYRLNRVTLTAGQLNEYSGHYYSTELNAHYSIHINKDQLELLHSRLDPVNLKPEIIDRFTTTSDLFSTVQFQRNEQKKISGFKMAGIPVVFEKQSLPSDLRTGD